MRLVRLFLFSLALVGIFQLTAFATSNTGSELFPLPENLIPNVKFWIKVYSQYNQNQVILHDSYDMHIIYEVVNMDELFDDENVSDRRKWRKIREIKNEYRDILRNLARRNITKPESLNDRDRAVYELFGTKPDRQKFLKAANRIRAQSGLRDRFKQGLILSGRYMDHIQRTLQKYGLPLQLSVLPHVESSFNNKAYSKFGAAGLWQFTRSTGRMYLDINYTVDDRFHPDKATDAATRLLRDNYQILKTWPLALTAYNHGVNGMKRAVRRLGTRDIGVIAEKYRSRQFGFASRNFYAEFLAALHVVENYKKYFGDIVFEKPIRYLEIELPNYIKLSTLEKQLNISTDRIKEYNPSLRRSVLNSTRRLPKGFKLRIPYQEAFDFEQFYAQIPGAEKRNRQIESNWYRVRSGDNLRRIAARFNTSVEELLALNDDIVNSHRIYINQIIRLPGDENDVQKKKKGSKAVDTTKQLAEKAGKAADKDIKWYQVQRGDRLEHIADRFGLSLNEIMTINDISDKNRIYSGQLLKLKSEKPEKVKYAETVTKSSIPEMGETAVEKNMTHDVVFHTVEPVKTKNNWYTVLPGDDLKKIADRNAVSVDELIKINKLQDQQRISVGQTLIIPQTGASVKEPERKSAIARYQINEKPVNKDILASVSSDESNTTQKIEKKFDTDQTTFSIEDKIYVMPDETLGHFADWLEVPTQKLRELNGLSFHQEIHLGQRIKIAYTNVRKEEFEQRRMEYHRGVEEDFFSNYRVDGVLTHQLKNGENIWYLSNEVYEVPYWLLVKYNPNSNFNRLRKGDEIVVPLVTSISDS
ncbi:LysM peptidoglycan-binding domain-containing protein [candidate division KSB1 bacterium]|nr:LysM peptidoglycan-binding domain-containing protein [candidate division KSB1 bacterium]